jgi:hypothetical protein
MTGMLALDTTWKSRCPYCYKLTTVVSRHIRRVQACRLQWEADAIAVDPGPLLANNNVSSTSIGVGNDELTIEHLGN